MISKANKQLSFINLIFLLVIPVVLILQRLGILGYAQNDVIIIVAVSAACSVIPFFLQRVSYNEQLIMHSVLFAMNVMMWLGFVYMRTEYYFVFLIVPLIAVRYASHSIVQQYSLLNFLVLLCLVFYRLQQAYGATLFDEHFSDLYTTMLHRVVEFAIPAIVINLIGLFVEHLAKERDHYEELEMKRLEAEKEQEKKTEQSEEREEAYDVQNFFYGISRDMEGIIRGKNKHFEMEVDSALPVMLIGLKDELREALCSICSDLLLYHEEAYVKMSVTFLAGVLPKRGQKITLQIEIRSNTDIAKAEAQHQALNFFLSQKIIDRLKGSFDNQSDAKEAVFIINVLQTVDNEMSIEKRTNRDLTEMQAARANQVQNSNVTLYRKIKVLVVDDNPESCKLIDAILNSVNVEADCVKNGLIGMKLLESQEYQMVFLDQMMPEKSGGEIVKEIRYMQDDYYQDIPVILMSLNTTQEAREEYEAMGFSDVIPKPIRVADIKRILQKWIREAYPLTYLEYKKLLEESNESHS
ncbi:MAG: response regulator [Lachnospiraceae bacterium]|nr:response regulator [Lachnospiraceae bacterium]